MRSTAVMVLAWAAATALAVLAASAAVRVVARQVSEDLPPRIPVEYLPGPSSSSGTDVAQGAPGESTSVEGTRVPTPTPSSAPRPTAVASTEEPSAAPLPPASQTRTVQTIGGSAGLEFHGSVVDVLWATPNSGYTVSAEGVGSDEVTVEFRSEDHRSRIRASSEDGQPDIRVEERGEGEDDED